MALAGALRRLSRPARSLNTPAASALLPRAGGAPWGKPLGTPVGPPLGCRHFSDGGGDEVEPYLDSWVCPDALYDYAVSHSSKDIDDEFFADFGRRNKTWRDRILREDPKLFEETGAGQAPKYLWIGCADSRVAAENMIDARPGEVFVHRNVANLVVNTDFNLRAVLKYAVEYLEVKHVIVCGHYDCGGVKAAFKNHDHGDPLESWLSNIRDVYRTHQDQLDAITDDDERHKRFVELSVTEQCLNLFKTADVQRRRAFTGRRPEKYECAYPRIHGMVFDPADGILRAVPIDFKEYIRKYKRVYQMYDADAMAD